MHLRDLTRYLTELSENNNRPWFVMNKPRYDILREEFLELVTQVIAELGKFDAQVKFCNPKKAMFRINRDVRFAHDKRPYKTAAAASFRWAGDGTEPHGRSHAENVHASGGYFHLQPGEIYVGGGVWHPEPSWLKGFRDRIVADEAGFRAIVEAPAFREMFGGVSDDGESLKRVPTGYPPDHPAADLLRKKNVTFGRRLSDAEATSPDLPSVIVESFAVGTPLLRYLATV